MEISFYQDLKLSIISVLDLSKDAIHIHIGLMIFFTAVVVWKKGRFELACLLPVLLIACLMEAMDLHDDYYSLGYMRWSASFHDMLNTLFWPVFIISLSLFRKIGKN